MAVRIQIRRGTAAEWTSANPRLGPGEQGIESDTNRMKIGNGSDLWTVLPYYDAVIADAVVGSGAIVNALASNQTVIDAASTAAIVAVNDAIGTVQNTVTDGIFEWWIHPTATYQRDPYARTVFGALSDTGKVLACEFNHGTGTTKRYEVGTATVDDHNPPALWVGDGRRSFIVWTNHNEDENLTYKVGSRSGDLASLVPGTQQTINVGGNASYTQVHKITALSDDDQDTFWIFLRRATKSWIMQPVSINQATGAVTWGTRSAFVESFRSLPYHLYIATAEATNDAGEQVIRAAVGFNPNVLSDRLWYFEVNGVTGDVTSMTDDAVTGNVITRAGLPLDIDAQAPVLDAPAAGTKRHMFASRPGPDTPAIGYAEWQEAAPADCRYKVIELFPGPADHLLMQGGNASTPHDAALNLDAGFVYETIVELPSVAPASNTELVRKFSIGTPSQGWRAKILSTKAMSVDLGIGSELVHTTGVPPYTWGDTIGVRLTVNISALTVQFHYSLNPLDAVPTWTSTAAYALTAGTTLSHSIQPLIVGGLTTVANAPRIYKATLSTLGGVLVAGVDWRTEWPKGTTTYTDTAGRLWTLASPATVVKTATVSDVGAAGPIFGFIQGSGYYRGLTFPHPSVDQAVITASLVGGVEAVTLYRPDSSGMYQTDVLHSQPAADGKLIRPYAPLNGGPFRAVVVDASYYASASYNDWDSDVRGIS